MAEAPRCPRCGATMKLRQAVTPEGHSHVHWICLDMTICMGFYTFDDQDEGYDYRGH